MHTLSSEYIGYFYFIIVMKINFVNLFSVYLSTVTFRINYIIILCVICTPITKMSKLNVSKFNQRKVQKTDLKTKKDVKKIDKMWQVVEFLINNQQFMICPYYLHTLYLSLRFKVVHTNYGPE